MEKEKERIERMLREGKITKEQSEELLKALEESVMREKKIAKRPKRKIIAISIIVVIIVIGGLFAIFRLSPKFQIRERKEKVLVGKEVNLLKNSSFEESVGIKVAGWWQAWQPSPGLKLYIDKEVAHFGKASACILNTNIENKANNNWRQHITDFPTGKKLKLIANIKTKDLADDAVASVCARCMSADKLVAFFTTQHSYPFAGTTDWTKVETIVIVPKDCVEIQVLALLHGTGQVWFDDIQLVIQ